MFKRNRTSSKYIYYALNLYFSGLSLRKTSEHLSQFIKSNHVSIWNWIQRYKPSKISQKRKKKVSEFIIDETLLKEVRNKFVWLWIVIEPIDKIILGIHISFERTMLLLLNNFYKNWLGNMENIQFQLMMEVRGIHKPVNS
jgi:putative transposase